MYEEPYRWVEAVGNGAVFGEQFKQGSPVVALTYDEAFSWRRDREAL
jgi:hypothetical protein